MEGASHPAYRSPVERLGLFVRNFLPDQNLQLLFPLGASLLLLGASHTWYLLRLPREFDAVLRQSNYQFDLKAWDRFNHAYYAWVVVEEAIAMAAVRFGFFASLVLWSLPTHKIFSKFIAWVFLPAGMALGAFPVFLIATAKPRIAIIDALLAAAHVSPPAIQPWLPTLNVGFYLAISGLIILATGLMFVRKGTISLPLRFRSAAEMSAPSGQETPHDVTSRVFFLLQRQCFPD
jgi:hypothetical protein